jgi:aerobic carbon-monoxide dehydrogenase medium subunit
MKPAPFEYHAPTSLDHALDLLATLPGDARALAGGQSLVPAMNLRLATPTALVDLNGISGCGGVAVEDGELVVGMLARHRDLERVVPDDPLGRLLAATARLVGHLPIRMRGTFAGSLAHADPAAEWCALALALDATIVARSRDGHRSLSADEFFDGPFTTTLEPAEVISSVRLPLLRRAGAAIIERSQTAGDFATIVAVVALEIENDSISDARLSLGGAEGRPVRASAAEAALVGAPADPDAFDAAALTAAEGVDAVSDAVCSGDYRRQLVQVLTRRALDLARAEAAA